MKALAKANAAAGTLVGLRIAGDTLHNIRRESCRATFIVAAVCKTWISLCQAEKNGKDRGRKRPVSRHSSDPG
jgi:hypothetical protein